jgi:tetratricopeptide (TPR) repeat protein
LEKTPFGPYAVTSEIYRGPQSIVLRGLGPDGSQVAIKILLGSSRPDAVLRERRLLAQLGKEEGFVPLLDAGQSSQGPYLVSPFLPGGTLRDRLEKGRLSVEETIEIGRTLASAAARAHELGIVHRDLKPENVLYDAGGRPLVADLGIAKHYRAVPDSRSASISLAGELRGTVGFMSPEQMRDAKSVGPTADVFAIGAILQECLTGEPAFAGGTVLEVLANVEANQRLPLLTARPEAPRWLIAAIDTALRFEPRRRFANGAALFRALSGPRKGRGALVALALAALAAIGTAMASPILLRAWRVSSDLERAAAGESSGDWRAAAARYDEVLREDPASEPAHAGKLRCETELALAKRKVIEAGVATAREHRIRAHMNYVKSTNGDVTLAEIAAARKALDGLAAPDDPDVALETAEIELVSNPAAKLESSSIVAAEHALALQPSSTAANCIAGEVQLRTGRVDEALHTFETALARDPNLVRAKSGRARSLAAMHAPDAYGALSAVIAEDPDDAQALYARILCTSDQEQKLRDLNELTERQPAVPGWHRMRAGMLLTLGRDLQTARADLDVLVREGLAGPQNLLQRAMVSARLGDVDAALADLDEIEKAEPESQVAAQARQLRQEIEKRH